MSAKIVQCPRCQAAVPLGSALFPFCSERCKLLDLGEWLSERNAVQVTESQERPPRSSGESEE